MHRLFSRRVYGGLLFATGCLAQTPGTLQALRWQEARPKFRINNPTGLAGEANITEAWVEKVQSMLELFKPHKQGYLDAEREYRNTEPNLLCVYVFAANQVNFAEGREVMQ